MGRQARTLEEDELEESVSDFRLGPISDAVLASAH